VPWRDGRDEGLHIRVGQQPEGCVVSAAQAGISEHQGILVGQKEQRRAIDPELVAELRWRRQPATVKQAGNSSLRRSNKWGRII